MGGPAGPSTRARLAATAPHVAVRLRPEALAVKLSGFAIDQLSAMPVADLRRWMAALPLDARERAIADKVVQEINDRLSFLDDVGVGYLTLDRSSATLSGGESQRIRLATQIGSKLMGVLYVLDEPSIGLHQRDNGRLLATLKRLRDLGNTVIVVEHDEEAIRTADWVIDMGPGGRPDLGNGDEGREAANAERVGGATGRVDEGGRYLAILLPRSISLRGGRREQIIAWRRCAPTSDHDQRNP